MGKTKNLDQLLKELNEMQMQFDNLKDEMVVKDIKRKKNKIKTELASDNIDNDFFKTLSTAPKNIKTIVSKPIDNKIEQDNTSDEFYFSLDIEHEEIKDEKQDEILEKEPFKNNVIIEISNDKEANTELVENNKDIIDSENIETKINVDDNLHTKKEIIVSNYQNSQSKKVNTKIETNTIDDSNDSKKSYLSIKQKLDKIKQEIADRELEINKEQIKIKKLTQNTTNQNLLTKKVLAPVKKKPIEKKVISNSKSTTNAQTLEPTTKVIPKIKKKDTVDVLTIIILVLLIGLIITAWALLK